MMETPDSDLRSLGRRLAEEVAGRDAVGQVAVQRTEDSEGRPSYLFVFLIDRARTAQRPGLLRVRLLQRLRDALIERGDERYPFIQMLDQTDWERWAGAKPS